MYVELCINCNIYVFLFLLIIYFCRNCIFRKCVLCMFKKSGNICILEKKTTIDPFTHALKDETNEVLNVARHDIKENVTLFVTNTKFYELLFLRGEEGLSEAFIKEYFETEELEDLLQIVHNGLNRNIYKLWFAFY